MGSVGLRKAEYVSEACCHCTEQTAEYLVCFPHHFLLHFIYRSLSLSLGTTVVHRETSGETESLWTRSVTGQQRSLRPTVRGCVLNIVSGKPQQQQQVYSSLILEEHEVNEEAGSQEQGFDVNA